MDKYFGLNFEFDKQKLENLISNFEGTTKGYCCFVDHTLLVTSFLQKNKHICKILNSSTVNFCDGSYIALMINAIYGTKYFAYNGPDFLKKTIFEDCKHCIIGGSESVYNSVQKVITLNNCKLENYKFVSLPFLGVDEFDYKSISNQINSFSPKYIWISLGAPKQEEFMFNLLPNINSGLMFGIGAALNYFAGVIKPIPSWAKRTHLIWFYRILTEPRKQLPRCIRTFYTYPILFIKEILLKFKNS